MARAAFARPIVEGNIDLHNRPVAHNRDGTISTVLSMSFAERPGGPEILIPMVVNGRVVSETEAVAEYRRTGRHLGIFRTPEEATAYAEQLHQDQAREYGGQRQIDPNSVPSGNPLDPTLRRY